MDRPMELSWVGTPADPEFDVTAAIARSDKIKLTWYCALDPRDVNNDFHLQQITKAPNIDIVKFEPKFLNVIIAKISHSDCDLVIFKHPIWRGQAVELLKAKPVVEWTWEWIPNIAMKQMSSLQWPRIAVTNKMDFYRAEEKFPDRQILYLPFGTVPRESIPVEDKYKSDLVADALPHWACGCYNDIKKISVDTMVRPVLDLDLALWGSRYGIHTKHDWLFEKGFIDKHKGTYPTKDYYKVYASSKIYLGVTWNAPTGGYSTRLARALSCGIMVIWQKTHGSHEDFDATEKIFEWSESPEQTRELVEYYLTHEDERKRVAKAGQEWALKKWDWVDALLRLSKEVR